MTLILRPAHTEDTGRLYAVLLRLECQNDLVIEELKKQTTGIGEMIEEDLDEGA